MNELTTTQTQQMTIVQHETARWELLQRKAKAFANATIVPKEYQNNMGNIVIAIDVAHRLGANELMVMQNLHVIHGRPSWSAQFIIAALNTCGRFHPLKFEITGEGDARQCVAWTKDKEDGERLESPAISIKMAKDEGWYGKNGSKWKTMPDVMLRYRAASFFGRMYAPDVLMGMYSSDEVAEMKDITPTAPIIEHEKEDIITKLNAEVAQQQEAQPETPHDPETGEVIEVEPEAVQEEDPQEGPDRAVLTLDQLRQMPYQKQGDIKELCKEAVASIKAGAVEKLAFMQAFPDLPKAADTAGAFKDYQKVQGL